MTPEERAWQAMLAREANDSLFVGDREKLHRGIAEQIHAAIAEERAACAILAYPKTTHVCSWSECGDCAGKDIAAAIRARTQTSAPPTPPARQDPGEEIKELGGRPR